MMWVFGYGSLVWKVDFPVQRSLVGHIDGYVRRFYQHSLDHRGVPHKPGRVVTLLPGAPDDAVWGRAYEISSEDERKVADHLDFREKNGYSKRTVTFHPADPTLEPFVLCIYIATPDNPSFAGEADVERIAHQVFHAEGPSGTNREYVYRLAAAMREIAPCINDDHLFRLEEAVKQMESQSRNH